MRYHRAALRNHEEGTRLTITDSLAGRTISHYKVLRPLGAGGMGVVYEAQDTQLGRRVAVKFLSAELQRDPAVLERFQREARAASALNHPGICTVHSIEQHEGQHFIVMELIEGETLASRIGRQPLPIDQLLDFGIQIADALESAHSKGIVHRDLKPVNLIVNARGQVKILDFGLAKIAGVTNYAEGPASSSQVETSQEPGRLTVAGTVLGTVHYMSPEQARGLPTDARTDLFSFRRRPLPDGDRRAPFRATPTPSSSTPSSTAGRGCWPRPTRRCPPPSTLCSPRRFEKDRRCCAAKALPPN